MELRFTAGIDRNQFKSDIDAMRRDILGLNNTVKSETSKMDSAFKNLSLGIAGYFSVNAVQGFVRELINVRGEFQKTEIAFTTMLGNADQAKSLMNDMVTLAAKTPFSLQDVSSGAKQLLAFQVPANEVVDTLTRLGNIAAGLSVPLSRINLVYGQVKAKGKLMGDDLRQFTEAGIPMVAELAKKFGTTTAEISKMVSAGKIGFNDVKDVLFSMTNEGGMFFNLMEKQSKSLSGQIANLGDSWDQMLNKIGEANDGILSDGIQGLTYLIENYEDVIGIIETLVVTYGAYKAGLIVLSSWQRISATMAVQQALAQGSLTLAQSLGAAATIELQLAQASLNTTMLANPIVLLSTVVIGLTFAYLKLRDNTTEAERTQKRLSESMEKVKNTTEKLKNSTEEYLSIVKSEYSTQLQKFQAYQKLQNLYPSMLKNISMENFLKMETVEINKLLAIGQEELGKVAFEKQIDKSAQRIQSLKNEIKILNNSLGKGTEGSDFAKLGIIEARNKALKAEENTYRKLQFIQSERNRDEEVSKMNAKERSAYFEKEIKSLTTQLYQQRQKNKNLKNSDILTIKLGNSFANLSLNSVLLQIDRMKAGLSEANAEIKNLNKPSSDKTKADWEKVKEDAQNKLNELTISEAKGKKGDLLKKQIADAEKALEAWNPIKEKKQKEEKQLADIFPKGSIKELQQRAQLIQEAIDTAIGSQVKLRKLDKYGNDKDKKGNPFLTGEIISIEEAGKRIEAINAEIKKRQIKSFDEQISELKRQFSVRDKLLEQGYSKESVDSMFPDLKDKNLLQSMKDKAKALNDIVTAGKGDSQAKENLANINEQIRILEGRKTVLEEFTKNLDEAKNGKSSSKYIDFLDSQISTGGSELDLAKNAEILKRIEAEIEAQKQRYQEFLAAHQSFEERKNAISKSYAELRQKIEADTTLNNEQKKNALEKAGQEEADAYSDAFMNELVNNPQYREAFADLENQTISNLKSLREKLEKELSENIKLSPDAKEKLRRDIEEITRIIEMKNPFTELSRSISNYLEKLRILKQAQQDYNNTVKQFGANSQEASNSLKKVGQAQQEVSVSKAEMGNSLANFAQKGMSYISDVRGIITDVKGAFDDLGLSLDNGFGDVLEKMDGALQGMQQQMEGVMQIVQGILTGNPVAVVSGVVKSIAGMIKTYASFFNNDRKKERQIKAWANEVENLKVQYQELERAIEKALGDDKYKAQQTVIANLEKQKILLQQMIKKEEDKKKTDKGKIKDWKQQISDLNNQISDIKDNIVNDILQIDVKGLADKIGDALVEGFGRGEDALDSLNKTADEVFKDMVKNALKMELEKRMQPIIDQMLKAMGYSNNDEAINKQIQELEKQKSLLNSSNPFQIIANKPQIEKINQLIAELKAKLGQTTGSFDGLTEEEREAIKAQIVAATGDYQKAMEQYADLFGPDAANNPNGLKGDIKGITEKTAGALESQINAIRIYQVEALNISKRNQQIFLDALKYQAEIAYNTRPLFQIQKDIAELNSKVKKPLAGLDN